MASLDFFSIFPLKPNDPQSREFTEKDHKLRITLVGRGDFVEHAKIDDLTTGKTLYDWKNIPKGSVQAALNDVVSKL